MRVEKVTLVGSGESWEWSFAGTVTVLNGPIGVGKTSLLELIKFGLGGDGLLSRTVRDVGSRVALYLDLPTGKFVFVRPIGSGSRRVSVVTAEGQPVRTLPTQATPQEESVSTWLLDQLGIPSTLRMPRSRIRPKDEFTRVSFFDVYTYMYLEQSEADRSTAYDLDSVRDPKRRQTFEVIYRLLGQDIANLRVRAAELERSIRDRSSAEEQIAAFLQRLKIGDPAQLKQEERRLAGQLIVAERELAATREAARAQTVGLDQPRDDLQQLRDRIREAQAQRDDIAQETEALERLHARIKLDHQRTARALTAGGVLASAAWDICPRCLQDLPEQAAGNLCVCVCVGRRIPNGFTPMIFKQSSCGCNSRPARRATWWSTFRSGPESLTVNWRGDLARCVSAKRRWTSGLALT